MGKLIASILVNSILLKSTGRSNVVSTDSLLLETGVDYLLLESGDKLLIE